MESLGPGKLLLQATEAIVNRVRGKMDPVFFKLQRMQEIYLNRNRLLYSEPHKQRIRRHFESVAYKFLLTDIQLEQLWALSEDARLSLWKALDNSLGKLGWNDNQLISGSVFLESFLFEARSFIDVFLFYVCLLMGYEKPGMMSAKKFYSRMKSTQEPVFKRKSARLHAYFENNVFGKDRWGKLLTGLRDKIGHQEHLRPSYEGSEKLFGKVLLDWPTLRGKTFDRLCQEIEDGMFDMIRETSPVLFDLEWKSGPYKPDIWKETRTQ